MNSVTDLRETVAIFLHDKATPKEAIAALGDHESQPGVATALSDLKSVPWNAKAKAAPILNDLLEKLDAAEEEGASAVARIPEIEQEITEHMQTAVRSLFKIGQLLNEAREEFENAKDFIEWSFDKFGFKKAYVHRLMQVAESFDEDDALTTQSIRVMHKLAGFPEEVKQAAREQVEETGKVTEKQVEQIARLSGEGAGIGAQGAQEDAVPESAQSTVVDTNASESEPLGDEQGAPWSPETGQTVEQGAEPQAVDADPEKRELRELVQSLQAELAAMRQEKDNASKPKGSAAPMLPQFASDCLYARLGLSAEQGADPAAVRKAFRALVKAGYNSKHEAYPALIEARDALMKSEAA